MGLQHALAQVAALHGVPSVQHPDTGWLYCVACQSPAWAGAFMSCDDQAKAGADEASAAPLGAVGCGRLGPDSHAERGSFRAGCEHGDQADMQCAGGDKSDPALRVGSVGQGFS